MDWQTIRTHYERAFNESGKTQTAVAKAGGLRNQNVLSKLLANKHDGPHVMTFVRALRGLGMSPATFFSQLEAQLDDRERARLGHVATTGRSASRPLPISEAEFREHAKLLREFIQWMHTIRSSLLAAPAPRRRRARRKR